MIDSFRGDYYFLSNFYEAPVTYDGLKYRNNEAVFQSRKCSDPEDRTQFTSLTGAQAKRLGRSVRLRPDWEDIKYDEMKNIVQAKFSQHPDLARKLIATGDEYICEGNNWGDTVWGRVNGHGQNLLGEILMDERRMLKELAKESEKKDGRISVPSEWKDMAAENDTQTGNDKDYGE